MAIESLPIAIFIASTIFAIFGYFLKMIHSDVRKNTEELGKLKGKIELVQQETQIKYQALQELGVGVWPVFVRQPIPFRRQFAYTSII